MVGLRGSAPHSGAGLRIIRAFPTCPRGRIRVRRRLSGSALTVVSRLGGREWRACSLLSSGCFPTLRCFPLRRVSFRPASLLATSELAPRPGLTSSTPPTTPLGSPLRACHLGLRGSAPQFRGGPAHYPSFPHLPSRPHPSETSQRRKCSKSSWSASCWKKGAHGWCLRTTVRSSATSCFAS